MRYGLIAVTPIAITNCDWNTLFGAVSKIIGRPINAGLDSKNVSGRGLAEYISCLGEFHTQNTDPIAAQRAAGFLLKHAHVSFFCWMPASCVKDLLIAGDVSVMDCENECMTIASSTLEKWRTTIINLCSENQTAQMRELGTKLLQAFDSIGLTRIFESHSRKTSTQGGLLLIQQK